MAYFTQKSKKRYSTTIKRRRIDQSTEENAVVQHKALQNSLTGWYNTNTKSGIQAKLEVSSPDDSYEQEANAVADKVVGMSDKSESTKVNRKEASSLQLQDEKEEPVQAQLIQRENQEEEKQVQAKFIQRQVPDEEDKTVQAKSTSTKLGVPENEDSTGIEDKLNSSTGQGSPLPDSTRSSMEGHFGVDFGQVRVHTDSNAVQMNKELGAQAFTHGNDIYFNSGKYNPENSSGKHLLAHELTHTLQQKGNNGIRLVQRAEVDDRSSVGLTDITSDIDTKVNSEIAAARAESGKPMDIQLFLKKVMKRLGKGVISPIEDYIEGLPASKRKIPPSDLSGTKYSGVGDVRGIYKFQVAAHVVGSSVKINNICIGADKLGHFFQEGYNFFLISSESGKNADDAKKAGSAWEIGIQGLDATGVYSNADLAANLSGMQFYNDLKANPSLTFNIKNYINAQWNEQSNPSFYSPDVGGVVWSNLLTGLWSGGFTSEQLKKTVPIIVNLVASANGYLTGTYFYPTISPTNFGTIQNGVITMKLTSVSGIWPEKSPVAADTVSGISIQFDWNEAESIGKALLNSVDEQTLEGTWGNNTSINGGGTWYLKKT